MNQLLKIPFLILLSLPVFGKAQLGAKEKENIHIYLCIGQSNMAGRAKVPEDAKGKIPSVLLLNDKDVWEDAENPLNRYSTIRKGLGMQKLGPSYGFAKKMTEKLKGIKIGLVVNAKGGSRIESWAKGTKFYKEAVRRTQEALKQGTLKGIIWHQGESNGKNPETYLEKLSVLIADLRAEFKSPKLPFVAGQVNNLLPINEAIAKLPLTVKGTGFVKSEGLKAYDRWHFDTPSALLLGERYANEMLKLLEKK